MSTQPTTDFEDQFPTGRLAKAARNALQFLSAPWDFTVPQRQALDVYDDSFVQSDIETISDKTSLATVGNLQLLCTKDLGLAESTLENLQDGTLQDHLRQTSLRIAAEYQKQLKEVGVNVNVYCPSCFSLSTNCSDDNHNHALLSTALDTHDAAFEDVTRDYKIDFDNATELAGKIHTTANRSIQAKRIEALKDIKKKIIPNAGHDENLEGTIVRQKQLEDILSFALPTNKKARVEILQQYVGTSKGKVGAWFERQELAGVLDWYQTKVLGADDAKIDLSEWEAFPPLLSNPVIDSREIRVSALHYAVERLAYFDSANQYVAAAQRALKDLEQTVEEGNILSDKGKEAAQRIWSNTVRFSHQIKEKRAEFETVREYWQQDETERLTKYLKGRISETKDDERARYEICLQHAKSLEAALQDFPYETISTMLNFMLISEQATPESAKEISVAYESARNEFRNLYPASKPRVLGLATYANSAALVIGDGNNFVYKPLTKVKGAKAIAELLSIPSFDGVAGAPNTLVAY